MDFTELVARKIEERREGRSAAVQAANEAERRFRARVAPLRDAIMKLLEALSQDPMFASAVGRSEVTIQHDDRNGRAGSLKVEGRVGLFSFNVHENGTVGMTIYPSWPVSSALDCMTYTVEPIMGDLLGRDEFLHRVCDHIGDFLADIYFSPVAHLLQPKPAA